MCIMKKQGVDFIKFGLEVIFFKSISHELSEASSSSNNAYSILPTSIVMHLLPNNNSVFIWSLLYPFNLVSFLTKVSKWGRVGWNDCHGVIWLGLEGHSSAENALDPPTFLVPFSSVLLNSAFMMLAADIWHPECLHLWYLPPTDILHMLLPENRILFDWSMEKW